jgi:PKD repeat protein
MRSIPTTARLCVAVILFASVSWSCKKKSTATDYVITFDFSYSGTACPGGIITFKASAPPDGHLYWDFGDGTTSTETTPKHTFNAADTFNVTLIINNDPLYEIQKKITIYKAPVYTRLVAGDHTWLHYHYDYYSSGRDSSFNLGAISFPVNYIDNLTVSIGSDTLNYTPTYSNDSMLFFTKVYINPVNPQDETQWTLQYSHHNNAMTFSKNTSDGRGNTHADSYYLH